jgi:hypothetical protein
MVQIIAGLLAVTLGLWGMSVWWFSVEELLRGLTPILLILFGVVALMAGVSAPSTRLRTRSDRDLVKQMREDD